MMLSKLCCTTTSILCHHFVFSRKIWRSRRWIVKLRQADLFEGPRPFVAVNDNLKRWNMIILQRSSGPSSEVSLRLTELVLLTLNCFSFGGNYFKQTNGVAMGTKMGAGYANLFVDFIEHQFCSQYHGPKPELYGRYIDDCIGATSSTREELTQFITAVNSFHPALKYTWEISDTSLAFLDIKISIEGNGLCSSVYFKPIDSHSYLYSSSHPSHVKNSIPFSQFLRLRIFCSDDCDIS